MLNIWGVMLFIRLSWIFGHAGWGESGLCFLFFLHCSRCYGAAVGWFPPDSVCDTNKLNLIEATRPDTSYMSVLGDVGAAASDSRQLKDYTVLQSLGSD